MCDRNQLRKLCEFSTVCFQVPAYLRHVKKRLEEEANRVDYYLDYTTRRPLMALTEKCLIADHMDSFIRRGRIFVIHFIAVLLIFIFTIE